MESKVKEHWFQRIEEMHPYQTLLYLGMIGSGILFLFLTASFCISYSLSAPSHQFQLPFPFYVSTFVLVASSLFVSRIKDYYHTHQLSLLQYSLAIAFALGLLFSILQLWGWRELQQMGVGLKGIPSGSYLYILTGIHLFHLLGVLIYVLLLLTEVHRSRKDPIKDLIYANNPYIKMKFHLFVAYWHFMDVIWVILFLILVLVS